MQIVIASNDPLAAEPIRNLLRRHDPMCEPGPVLSLQMAADRAGPPAPELLLVVAATDREATLSALRAMRKAAPAAYIVVVGPADDSQRIVAVLCEGADEFLDQAALGQELDEAILRFHASRDAAPGSSAPGRVIAVAAASGGSGASMLAANLSVLLAKADGQCALLDLGAPSGDLASMLALKPARTLADLCDHLSRMDQRMFAQLLTRHKGGVHLLAAPDRLGDGRRVTPKGVHQALAMARASFPCVVLDVKSVSDEHAADVFRQADATLLVMRLDYTSVRNLRRVLDHFVAMGLGLERVHVIANGCGQAKQISVVQAEEALRVKIAHCLSSDPGPVHEAINEGIPVVLGRPRAKISQEIRQLAERLHKQPAAKAEDAPPPAARHRWIPGIL